VAIRVFSGLDAGEKAVEEARKIAGLSHPNIAVQEVGIHEDQAFLVTELAGKSLEIWMSDEQALPDRMTVIEGIATAITHAHAHGVIHRALHPGSVQVTPEGEARVWNFKVGSAKSEGKADAYQAPELLEGAAPSPQSDIYSAGLVFYAILAGKEAAGGAASTKPIREIHPEVSRDASDAIMACRESAPDWRPKDLDYLIEVVHKVRGPGAPRMPRPTPRSRATPGPKLGAPPESGRPQKIALAAGGLVFVAGVLAWLFLSPHGAPRADTTRATTTTTLAAPPSTQAPATTLAAAPPPRPTPRATPTPVLATAATPEPTTTTMAAKATPTPAATPTPVATPTPTPTTLAAATPAPVPVPTTAPTLASPAAGPAVLRALSPPTLRRGAKQLVDVRGTGLTASHNPTLSKGKAAAPGLTVTGLRYVNESLVQVFIEVAADAPAGAYAIILTDGQGESTNPLRFDVK
jgi:hypothetical protein